MQRGVAHWARGVVVMAAVKMVVVGMEGEVMVVESMVAAPQVEGEVVVEMGAEE